MMYNKFSTEQEAIDASVIDWGMYHACNTCPCWDECEEGNCANEGNTCGGYWRTTKLWANSIQSLDGTFWAYPVCSKGVQTHEQIEFDSTLFYNSEDV